MPLGGRATATALATLAACLAVVGACDATDPDPDATASPSPDTTAAPEPEQGEARIPAAPATVLAGSDDAALALAASQAFFASAPVVVVAPAGDAEALDLAASVAVDLGAPVLLDPTGAEPAADPAAEPAVDPAAEPAHAPAPSTVDAAALRAEVDRLGARTAVTVGDVAADLGVAVVPAPGQAGQGAHGGAATEPAPTPSATPLVELLTPSATGGLPDAVPPEAPEGGLALTSGDPVEAAAVATARAAGLDVLTVPGGDPRLDPEVVRAFAADPADAVVGLGPAFGTSEELAWKSATAATGVELPGGGQVLFALPDSGRRMVALYGSPGIPALGLLGEQDVTGSIARARDLAAQYQALTSDVVVPAFEIIVTIADRPAGEDGNYSNELPVETFVPWVEAALEAGVYVVLDLQPGRTDFLTQAQRYEPLLRYPNVGLALDPEWRLGPDQVHLRQIGSVGVDEINAVAAWLGDLTREHHLPQKLLVVHQFMQRMVVERERLDTSDPAVQVLVHVDGQGSQGGKAGTWANLLQGAPAGVVWGWKNFIDEDQPMATPEQTYQVQPLPHFVSYQ